MTMTKLMTLGRDAEIRYTPSGMAVSMLSLCYRLPKHKNEKDYPVQWIRANFFGDRAEKIISLLENHNKQETLWTIDDIAHYTKHHHNLIYAVKDDPTFPKPVFLKKQPRYMPDEVKKWLSNRRKSQ